MIRAICKEDFPQIQAIWERYYRQEFSFPDFITHFLAGFVVDNGNGSIVCAGGVRTIAESVILTNKDFSVRTRRDALYQILQASLFTCGRLGYDHLSSWIIDDYKWANHLRKVGFEDIKGQGLFINIRGD